MALQLTAFRLLENPDLQPIICIYVADENCSLLKDANQLCFDLAGHYVHKSANESHFKLKTCFDNQGDPWKGKNFKVCTATEGQYAGRQGVGIFDIQCHGKTQSKRREQAAHLALSVSIGATMEGDLPDPDGTGLFAELVSHAKLYQESSVSVGSKKDEYLAIGFKGDSILLAKHDKAKKNKWRSFEEEFKEEIAKAIGKSVIDVPEMAGYTMRDVINGVVTGATYDVMCVGLGFSEHLFDKDSNVLEDYPEKLSSELEELAAGIKKRSNKSLVLVGGPASIWSYADRWDTFMQQASEVFESHDIKVVDPSASLLAMQQMELARDGMHFNGDHQEGKTVFAQAWADWLLQYADIASIYIEPKTDGDENGEPDAKKPKVE